MSASIRCMSRSRCAGGALHDGRHPHRHRRRHAVARPLRRRRMRLRVDQRRQSPWLQLAGRDSWCSARAPDAARRPFAKSQSAAAPPRSAQAAKPRTAASASCSCARAARDRWRAAQGDERHHGERRRHLSQRIAAGDLPISSPSCGALRQGAAAGPQQCVQHRLFQVLELGAMLQVAEAVAHSALSAASRAARTSGSIIPDADDVNFSSTASPPTAPMRRRRLSLRRGRSPARSRASGFMGGAAA